MDGAARQVPRWRLWLRRAIVFYGPAALQVLGAVGMSTCLWLGHYPVGFVIGLACQVIGLAWNLPSINRFIRVVTVAESALDSPTFVLFMLYRMLDLGPDERASLYVRDFNRYTMVGRWSDDQHYQAKRRGTYPIGQGVIHEAWRRGECYEHNIPDPAVDLDVYCHYMEEKWDIPREEARRFRMKSRSYYARALTDGMDNYAVLVIESTKPELPHNKIAETLTSDRWQQIFSALRPKLPAITRAQEEGL